MQEEEIGDAPPDGDIAWIWFLPIATEYVAGVTRSLAQQYHSHCLKCDTYGVKDPFTKVRRCWCCGRFVKGPEASAPLMKKYFHGL